MTRTTRFWKLAVLAVLGSLGAGCAAATTTASGGGQSRPPAVEVLPNGLTLIVQEHRAADIVAVHLWVATGVRYESPDTLGHAHFQEHMLFKGTDTFGPGHVDRTVEGTGGRSNAFTAADYTTFQLLVPSEATPTAIGLLDDMAFRSKFDPKEVNSERQVISEEARIETDTPRTAIVRQLYSLVFRNGVEMIMRLDTLYTWQRYAAVTLTAPILISTVGVGDRGGRRRHRHVESVRCAVSAQAGT